MKKYLVKLADHLDKKGLYKEANYLDKIIKLSDQEFEVDFTEPLVVDTSKPMGVAENLFELSWGTVFDIMVTDIDDVTSLKVELPNGKIVTYTKKYKGGIPLANTIKDLNAKYNLGLREPVSVTPKSKEEIIKDFQDTIIMSENMSGPESEEAFNYFYKNYPEYESDFVRLIREYKVGRNVARRRKEELAKIEEYKRSPKYKADKQIAINHLYKAIKMADEGDSQGAMERVDLVMTLYPHHIEDLKSVLAVLNRTEGTIAVGDMLESEPTYTSIETEEFVPVGPGLPTPNSKNYLP